MVSSMSAKSVFHAYPRVRLEVSSSAIGAVLFDMCEEGVQRFRLNMTKATHALPYHSDTAVSQSVDRDVAVSMPNTASDTLGVSVKTILVTQY